MGGEVQVRSKRTWIWKETCSSESAGDRRGGGGEVAGLRSGEVNSPLSLRRLGLGLWHPGGRDQDDEDQSLGKETERPRLGLAGLMGPRANLELGCKGLDGFGEAEAVARAARRAASATQDDTSV